MDSPAAAGYSKGPPSRRPVSFRCCGGLLGGLEAVVLSAATAPLVVIMRPVTAVLIDRTSKAAFETIPSHHVRMENCMLLKERTWISGRWHPQVQANERIARYQSDISRDEGSIPADIPEERFIKVE